MRTFLYFVLGYSRQTLILVVALGAASGFANAALIGLVSKLFVEAPDLGRETLLKGAGLLAVVALLALALDVTARYVLSRAAARRHRELHVNFSHIILNESLRKLERTGLARLITIYSEDMSIIGGALISISSVGTSVFVVLGCVGYLAWMSPGILVICAVLGLPCFWSYRKFHKRSVKLARASFVQRDSHVKQFKNIVNGIKELQLNYQKRQNYLDDEYLPTVFAHEKAFVSSHLAAMLGTAWMQLVYFMLMIAALVYVIMTEAKLEVLGPFLVVALFLRSYMNNLLTAVPIWSRAGVVLNRLSAEGFSTISDEIRLSPPSTELHTPSNPLSIKIDQVAYRYISEENDQPFTVGPLDLTLNSGELVFIVGHNGAGKTTFAKLLAGLYENESGNILCNGKLVDSSNRQSYRELFSAIFTDPHLFEALTVPDEVEVADSILDGRIAKYLERLQLSSKVKVEGNRLSSIELSYGQKKRLALLAAYLEDKPVLIFDEWAENQDPRFKEVFYRQILPELRDQGKLVIVISHEAQFFDQADRVITLSAQDANSQVVSNAISDATNLKKPAA